MKTNPINNLFCMGVILFFSYSCVPSKIITTTLEYKVVNLLDKKLYVSYTTDIGEENGICYPHDSIVYKFTRTYENKSYIILGPIDRRENFPQFQSKAVYILSDTTTLKQGIFNEQESQLYKEHIEVYYADIYRKETLYIDENILTLFTKDTTMLEKFKDYYSTSH